MTTYNEIESLLKRLPHKYQVSFALYCAEDIFHLVKDKYKPVIRKALDLTKAWLSGEEVSREELRNAAHAAYAAYTASSAANAAAYAAYTANAASAAACAANYAAYTAVNATYAAACAACAAACAASAAAYADAHKDKEEALNKYLSHLKTMIKAMSRIERLVYNLN